MDGTFKFFYSTAYPLSLEQGKVLIDNSEVGSKQHVCCYAESDDGIHWHRPALNLMLQDTFPDNNIIWQWPGYFNDSLSVIEDTIDPDPERLYKMLIYTTTPMTRICVAAFPLSLPTDFGGNPSARCCPPRTPNACGRTGEPDAITPS